MIPLFSATLFFSALLLFVVQPMVGKMILPTLGGAPAVWNTCMVFFQAALLAGYGYAHFVAGRLRLRVQIPAHIMLLLGIFFALPIAFPHDGDVPTGDNPVLWLLLKLAVGVGLPFFITASSAPLLQRWFAHSGHEQASDPYFLYAASNAGSFVALLGYPILIEPMLDLEQQSSAWSLGFIGMILMTASCGFAVLGAPRDPRPAAGPSESTDSLKAPSTKASLWWIVLAFVPSSLMLGVTTYITTDIAAVPLLWVVPLAIYLLTFVLTFARRPPLSVAFCAKLLPPALVLWICTQLGAQGNVGIMSIPFQLFIFFLAAMVCHGRLAESRPPAERLTSFYWWMSVGGVLGGVFNGLLAPVLFNREIEYQMVLVLACLFMPAKQAVRTTWKVDLVPAAVMAVVALGLAAGMRVLGPDRDFPIRVIGFFSPAIVCLFYYKRPVRFAAALGVAMLASAYFVPTRTGQILHVERNFFGVKRVRVEPSGRYRRLQHGGTAHGLQATDPDRALDPLGYYHPEGPLGDVFDAFGPTTGRVAVIGLGCGGMFAYAQPHHRFTFYDIDPAVQRIAENPDFFTLLAKGLGEYEIVIGDGRLRMMDADEGVFDLLLLDAFSSDAIPIHLLSREALAIYVSKTSADGVIVFHISNRYLDLAPVVAVLARDAGLHCLLKEGKGGSGDLKDEHWPARYMAMARDPARLAVLEAAGWGAVAVDPDKPVWTDRYSHLLGAVQWPW
mgnify:FL=1